VFKVEGVSDVVTMWLMLTKYPIHHKESSRTIRALGRKHSPKEYPKG
jgi:hypothetical protein